jgi:hypothetical protein
MPSVCSTFNLVSEVLLLCHFLHEILLLSLLYPDPASFYGLSVFANDNWNIHKPFKCTMELPLLLFNLFWTNMESKGRWWYCVLYKGTDFTVEKLESIIDRMGLLTAPSSLPRVESACLLWPANCSREAVLLPRLPAKIFHVFHQK